MTALNLVVAMSSEAGPLIEHFRLKAVHGERPQIYRNGSINLVVTGMGATAVASGIGYLAGRIRPSRHSVWLNVGVAGHQSLEVGALRLVHKVTNRDCGRSSFPSLLIDSSVESAECTTVSRVEHDYVEDSLYEMEAFSFFNAATRWAALDLVHAVKIVSDNPTSPTRELTHQRITALVRAQAEQIDSAIIQPLLHLAARLQRDSQVEILEHFSQRWHYSAANRARLESLLLDFVSIMEHIDLGLEDLKKCDSREQVFTTLEQAIAGAKLHLS